MSKGNYLARADQADVVKLLTQKSVEPKASPKQKGGIYIRKKRVVRDWTGQRFLM